MHYGRTEPPVKDGTESPAPVQQIRAFPTLGRADPFSRRLLIIARLDALAPSIYLMRPSHSLSFLMLSMSMLTSPVTFGVAVSLYGASLKCFLELVKNRGEKLIVVRVNFAPM